MLEAITAARLMAILAKHIDEGADPHAPITVVVEGERHPVTRCYRLGGDELYIGAGREG